jgi:Mrp family chromosome partitioning ATPase
VVHRAKDLLVDVNANLLGVVLNNATETLPYYYDYRYYGYHHSRPVANN